MVKNSNVSNLYVNNLLTMGGGIAPKYFSIKKIIKEQHLRISNLVTRFLSVFMFGGSL